jgi:RNA polymerase sigma-70 factor (ECF subfamily)
VTTANLAALLAAGLVAERRGEVAAIDGLDALLAAQHAQGAAAWPTVALASARYVEQLARCVQARAEEPAERVIGTMPAADLFLAAACGDGDPAALAAFQQALVPTLRQALGKLAMPAAAIDETVQRVMLMLFVGDGGPPQIAGYSGRGALRSWLRTIGVRTGRRLLGVAAADIDGDDELDAVPAAVPGPELELLRGRYRDQVREAIAIGFSRVGQRQRDVLRQYYLEQLTIDQLATIYSINRATAARWVAAARLAVINEARVHLVEVLGSSVADIDSIIRLVRSQIQLSVRDLVQGR